MAASIAAGILTTTTSRAQDGTPAVCQDSRAPVLCETQTLRQQVWRLQAKMSLPRSPTSYSDRRRHAPLAYRLWVRDLWRERLDQLEARHARWLAAEGDLLARVNAAWPYYENWVRIAVCETGNKPGHPRGVPDWQHSNSSYQGGLGFAISSWDGFKPAGWPEEAYQATPLQQMVTAEAIYDEYGLSGWGCRGAA